MDLSDFSDIDDFINDITDSVRDTFSDLKKVDFKVDTSKKGFWYWLAGGPTNPLNNMEVEGRSYWTNKRMGQVGFFVRMATGSPMPFSDNYMYKMTKTGDEMKFLSRRMALYKERMTLLEKEAIKKQLAELKQKRHAIWEDGLRTNRRLRMERLKKSLYGEDSGAFGLNMSSFSNHLSINPSRNIFDTASRTLGRFE